MEASISKTTSPLIKCPEKFLPVPKFTSKRLNGISKNKYNKNLALYPGKQIAASPKKVIATTVLNILLCEFLGK